MGLVQALRVLVSQLDGALSDYTDCSDEAGLGAPVHSETGGRDDLDEIYRDEPLVGGRPLRERAPRPLALVRPPHLEVLVVMPNEFADAQQIADRLRAGGPVILDLQSSGRELSRRLTDFCSGLSYALDARLQLIGEQVVLLAPQNLELSSEAPSALQERRFFNQA
jgi:cell division inhibitor SepF